MATRDANLNNDNYIIMSNAKRGAMTVYFADEATCNNIVNHPEDFAQPFNLYTSPNWSREMRCAKEFKTKDEAMAVRNNITAKNNLFYVITVARAREITVYSKFSDSERYIVPFSRRLPAHE